MATMSDEEFREHARKIAGELARLTRRKLRDMRRRMGRPRTLRLPKEARMLKSLLAEARQASEGLRPAPAGAHAATPRKQV